MTENTDRQTTASNARLAGNNSARKKVRRRWLPWIGAILLVALIVAGLWPKPTIVEVKSVAPGLLRATVNEEGKTRIRQRYTVSAPVSGQLRRIPYKAGEPIKAGETILAVIDPVTPTLLDERSRLQAQARRDSAAATLDKNRASHDFAASELRRFEQLHKQSTVSVQEYESVQMRATTTARELAVAESALRQAEAELAAYTPGNPGATNVPVEIKAPVGGRVLRVHEESSRVVAAGTPLVDVGDPTEIEVVIEVLSRDGAVIAPGTKVLLEQWGGNEPLEARVRLVEPAAFTKVSALGVEEQRVRVVADMVTPAEKRAGLGDQFRVESRIVLWEDAHALKAPSGALFRHGQEWAAFILKDGHAHLKQVKVGRSSGTEVQILEGLNPGDEVIMYPGNHIKDGMRVARIVL